MSELTLPVDIASVWGADLEPRFCPRCDWRYLAQPGAAATRCPHCARAELQPLAAPETLAFATAEPELVAASTLSAEALAQCIQEFAASIPFAPQDLDPATLRGRLQRCYLPLGLVDADAQAVWQAEVGFDYEAASHREHFDDNRGAWDTERIIETRIRWEPRVGRLQRAYHNVAAPALEADAALRQGLGVHDLRGAQPYAPALVERALVRLPDRSTADAWPDSVPAVQRVAAQECQQAASAQHIRDFHWTPEFSGHNWTLLLQPVYATYYLDDERQPQALLLHGQMGQVMGARRASPQRAQRMTLILVAIAAVLLILSLVCGGVGVLFPPLLIAAGLGVLLAVAVGVGALAPIIIVWRFNRQQAGE